MYKIYMLKFPNNKKYIGCTKIRLNYRAGLNGSKYVAKNIKNAIKEFGWNNVEQIILKEDLTYTEARFYEDFYINKYKTRDLKFGYNKNKGGGFAEKINTYNHVMTEPKKMWIETLKGKKLTEEHKQNIMQGHLKRLNQFIVQYDLENNIKKWNSASEIQRELGLTKQSICNCCFLNEQKPTTIHTAHGFIWRKEKRG